MRLRFFIPMAAAAAIIPFAAAAPAAASTDACSQHHVNAHCFGIKSNQRVRLELTATGGAGSIVRAETPAFRRAQDWVLRPGNDNAVSHIEWAPRGVRSGLCLTATRDVAGADLRLEPCQSGVAGVSHQLWLHHDHGVNYNYQNMANRMYMTVHGDTSGAPVQVRPANINAGNQVFTCVGPGQEP